MQLVSAWSFSLRAGTAAKWANVPQIGGSEAETCARGFEEQAVGAVNPVRFFFTSWFSQLLHLQAAANSASCLRELQASS